ncbi:MAG TPA: 3-phosphoshikimate 1-carboxyvinyltransferase [Pyrinomonadaceae bacterium]|nr:3-phosphoshikimate 1-carboxyvinyltransferase [Pyrinomonadaceae bacterium]
MNNSARPIKSENKTIISPAKRLRGSLLLPGDKSISHRAAIISALAHDGVSEIKNFSTGEDCAATLRCLRNLGVSVEVKADSTVRIGAAGAQGFERESLAPLDCGNSGSTMRMLAGALAGQNLTAVLTGDASLQKRPMKRIIEPLRLMGASITSQANCAPLKIEGRHPLHSISYEMPTASAQVKSCLLLAGLNAFGQTKIIEKFPATRDHTERMLRWFGVNVETQTIHDNGASKNVLTVGGPVQFAARDFSVPGDMSSAAFFIAAAAMLDDSELEITGVGLNPTRSQILDTLRSWGVEIEISNRRDECNEPVGDLRISRSDNLAPQKGGANVLRGAVIASLIDELPILAVLGTQIQGGIEIRDAGELRVKESDRIQATVENLRRMGAAVEEFEDGLMIDGPVRLKGARVDSYGDHRIAMAFAVAALCAEGESEIGGAECVAVSFPEFFGLLESVIER